MFAVKIKYTPNEIIKFSIWSNFSDVSNSYNKYRYLRKLLKLK